MGVAFCYSSVLDICFSKSSVLFGACTLCFMFTLQQINEKPQVIQEYESGKAIPNQQIIVKLERALGTKLRGKK